MTSQRIRKRMHFSNARHLAINYDKPAHSKKNALFECAAPGDKL